METVVEFIDADDLVWYGVAHRFLVWLTALLMRTSYDGEEAA